jgi:hypothetical protein
LREARQTWLIPSKKPKCSWPASAPGLAAPSMRLRTLMDDPNQDVRSLIMSFTYLSKYILAHHHRVPLSTHPTWSEAIKKTPWVSVPLNESTQLVVPGSPRFEASAYWPPGKNRSPRGSRTFRAVNPDAEKATLSKARGWEEGGEMS